MELRLRSHPRFDVLLYSGIHCCNDNDHEQDRQAREFLADRVGAGQTRFLIDVRNLRVDFPSGRGDLWNSWEPAREQSKGRLAILWKPITGYPDYLASFCRDYALESSESKLASVEEIRVFLNEDSAHAFLLAEEPESETSSSP
jgi:hypothetical protein